MGSWVTAAAPRFFKARVINSTGLGNVATTLRQLGLADWPTRLWSCGMETAHSSLPMTIGDVIRRRRSWLARFPQRTTWNQRFVGNVPPGTPRRPAGDVGRAVLAASVRKKLRQHDNENHAAYDERSCQSHFFKDAGDKTVNLLAFFLRSLQLWILRRLRQGGPRLPSHNGGIAAIDGPVAVHVRAEIR